MSCCINPDLEERVLNSSPIPLYYSLNPLWVVSFVKGCSPKFSDVISISQVYLCQAKGDLLFTDKKKKTAQKPVFSVHTWRAAGSTRQQPTPLERCCSQWCIWASPRQSKTPPSGSRRKMKILNERTLYSNIKASQNAVRHQNDCNVSKWAQITAKIETKLQRGDDCGITARKLSIFCVLA